MIESSPRLRNAFARYAGSRQAKPASRNFRKTRGSVMLNALKMQNRATINDSSKVFIRQNARSADLSEHNNKVNVYQNTR